MVGAWSGKTGCGCAASGCVMVLVVVVCVKGAFGVPARIEQVRPLTHTTTTREGRSYPGAAHPNGHTQLSDHGERIVDGNGCVRRSWIRGDWWRLLGSGRVVTPPAGQNSPHNAPARVGCPACDRFRPHPGSLGRITGAGTGDGDLGHLVTCPRSPPGVHASRSTPPRPASGRNRPPTGTHRIRSPSRGFRLPPSRFRTRIHDSMNGRPVSGDQVPPTTSFPGNHIRLEVSTPLWVKFCSGSA